MVWFPSVRNGPSFAYPKGTNFNTVSDDAIEAMVDQLSNRPLTQSEVDSIRTVRANGESLVSISRRFDVHRMTVCTHTKDLLA